jgi:AcrR family transcriptional regulator
VTSKASSAQPTPGSGGQHGRVRDAVMAATIELIVESGYDGLRFEDVATRSGVHKTTIYRRWPTKNDLVKEAIQDRTSATIRMPDTGSIEGDFLEIVLSLGKHLRSAVGKAVFRTAYIASNGEDDAAETGRVIWQRQVQAAQVVVRRAVDRGELPAVDTARLYEMLCGPVHLRSLTGSRPFTRAEARHHVMVLIAGLWAVDGTASTDVVEEAI